MKSYRVGDLVDVVWLLPHTSSHFQWLRSIPENEGSGIQSLMMDGGTVRDVNSGVIFDGAARTMVIETMLGDRYVFDYTTGETISSRRPVRIAAILVAVLFPLIYCLFLLRATAKPFRAFWKQPLYVVGFSIVIAILVMIADIWLSARYLVNDGPETSVLTGLLWKLIAYPPHAAAVSLGCGSPTNSIGWDLESVLFWFVVFLVTGATNNLLVGAIGKIRLRTAAPSK